jgi:predicted transcriptional regulator
MRYILRMKTAAIPSIRVEPALREQLEQVLAEGESLSAFVEASVRAQVQRRQQQAEFVARGMASMDAVRAGAPTLSLDESMLAVKRRITAARAKGSKTQSS